MAEQYESFRGREPNIDVNLFVDSVTKGIAQGHSSPGAAGAIAKGVVEGIPLAQQVRLTQAEAVAKEQVNEVNSDPLVIQARRDRIIADAEIAQAEAKYKYSEEGLAALAKRNEAQLRAAEAEQKYGDLSIKTEIQRALDDPSTPPDKLQQLFEKGKSALYRDDKSALPLLDQAKNRLDPAFFKNYSSSVDAVAREKTRVALQKSDSAAIQTQARKQEAEITEATSTVHLAAPQISEAAKKPGYDPSKLQIVKLGEIEIDKQTGEPLFDAGGKFIPRAQVDKDDTRVIAGNSGNLLGVFDNSTGSVLLKAYPNYILGKRAIQGEQDLSKTVTPNVQGPFSFDGTGLASESSRLDNQIQNASPSVVAPKEALAPSKEALEGKSPEQQAEITARYQDTVAKLGRVPREFRSTVMRINSDPLIGDAPALVKTFAAVESDGQYDAQSPATKDSQGNKMGGVKGLMQVTDDTYNRLAARYPTILKPEYKDTPVGEYVAGKMLIADLFNQFRDIALTAAAYNAGEAPIRNAAKRVRGPRTWESVKQELRSELSPEKFKETSAHVDKVLKYYSYFNA